MPLPRREWTRDELHVLTAIFLVGSFSQGDDERDECRVIAGAFGRSPSAIDRQWRNINALIKGESTLNIGRLVRETLDVHLADQAAGRKLALRAVEKNNWPLGALVRGQSVQGQIVVASAEDAEALRRELAGGMPNLKYTIFPSGTHGFVSEWTASLVCVGNVRCYVSCSLATADRQGKPVHAREPHVTSAVRDYLKSVTVARLPSGGISVSSRARIQVQSDDFVLAVRINQLPGGL